MKSNAIGTNLMFYTFVNCSSLTFLSPLYQVILIVPTLCPPTQHTHTCLLFSGCLLTSFSWIILHPFSIACNNYTLSNDQLTSVSSFYKHGLQITSIGILSFYNYGYIAWVTCTCSWEKKRNVSEITEFELFLIMDVLKVIMEFIKFLFC